MSSTPVVLALVALTFAQRWAPVARMPATMDLSALLEDAERARWSIAHHCDWDMLSATNCSWRI